MEQLIAKVEAQKAAVLADLRQWAPERLRFKPRAEAWCALDVLDHLTKMEAQTALPLKRHLRRRQPVPARAEAGLAAVNFVLRLPFRIKVPAGGRAVLPGKPSNLPACTRNWDQARARLLDPLRDLCEDQLGYGVLQHPVCGGMNAPGLLSFIFNHLRHHRPKLERLRRRARAV